MFAGFIIILRDFQAVIVLSLFVFCFCLVATATKKPAYERMSKATSTAECHAFYDRCSE